MATYVDKSLAPGEEILMRGRWPFIMRLWAWILLLGAVSVAIYGIVLGVALIWVFGILAIGVLLMYGGLARRMATTEFAVTTQRVILKTGWLDRRTAELAVASIEGVLLNQTIWERLFAYGKLVVTGTG